MIETLAFATAMKKPSPFIESKQQRTYLPFDAMQQY